MTRMRTLREFRRKALDLGLSPIDAAQLESIAFARYEDTEVLCRKVNRESVDELASYLAETTRRAPDISKTLWGFLKKDCMLIEVRDLDLPNEL